MNHLKTPSKAGLPENVLRLFWEYDAEALSLDTDRDLLIERVLTVGDWEAIKWLRNQIGDESLSLWLQKRQGAALSPRQLRFWQLILDLPKQEVNTWIDNFRSSVWGQRLAR